MSILLLTYNPLYMRIGLAALAVLLIFGYLLYHHRRSRRAQSKAPAAGGRSPSSSPQLFEYSSRPGATVLGEIMRGMLILLAVCVAAGLILISMPEGTIDRMAQSLRLRKGETPPQEGISLLYLGDEIKGKEFHIRGVIRNISTQPIEKLDAMIRLYASDGILIETTVVRMDAEVIAPDATASFNLAYPDFTGQFGSYSVDFKLRQGQAMPYKDMRGPRAGS
jgi:hypothetical protein